MGAMKLTEDEQYDLAMITCPYYWGVGSNTCRNGCWEEPACHTGGPFTNPPGWTDEQLKERALVRDRTERGPV